MPTWSVQEGSDTKQMSEEKLRKKLRNRDLSGLELARREDMTAWVPLHDLPIYREEVPVTGDPRAAAARRMLSGWATHLAVFALVVGGLTVSSGSFPFWSFFWGIGLFFHTLRALPAVGVLRGGAREPALTAAPTPQVVPVAEPAAAPSPFLSDVAAALAPLRAEGAGIDPAALDELRRSAAALEGAHAELVALSDDATRNRLQAELDEATAAAAAEPDARTAELLTSQADAVRERLEIAARAAAAARRLDVRKKTLLHQIEGLRLGHAQTRLDPDGAPDLSARVRALRADLDARGEVDEALARARQAQRARAGANR